MKSTGFKMRRAAATICSTIALDRILLNSMGLTNSAIRVITYHRIVDYVGSAVYPFDEELVDATSTEFRQQMHYLSKNYDLISFDEVIKCLNGYGKLPKRPLLITFDDGFRDIYESAFPIIKEYNAPAAILVATDYIGANDTLWFDKLAFIIFNTKETRISLREMNINYSLLASRIERRMVFRQIIKHISGVDNSVRLAILNELDRNYGDVYDSLPQEIKALSQPLTWGQVREMHAASVTIGSHTKSHPFLSRLSIDQLHSELAGSKQKIEDEIGSDVSVIAYPNGQRADFNDQVKLAVKDAGYLLGLSYINGVNYLQGLDRYEIKRLHISPSHDFSIFKMALSLPLIF